MLAAVAALAALRAAWLRRRPANPPRVVVLGASFAGLQAAFDLQHFAHVILIDRLSYFEYTPGVLRALVEPSGPQGLAENPLSKRQLPLTVPPPRPLPLPDRHCVPTAAVPLLPFRPRFARASSSRRTPGTGPPASSARPPGVTTGCDRHRAAPPAILPPALLQPPLPAPLPSSVKKAKGGC